MHRKVTAAALAVWGLIILGCMSISIGGKHFSAAPCENGTFAQCGETPILAGCEQDIYYPIPYASPPYLEIDGTFSECTIVEQHADHFRVKSTASHFSRNVKWTAKGVKAIPPLVPHVPPPAPQPIPPPPSSTLVPGADQGGPS